MIIDINEEEWKFILNFCVRAKALARMQIDIIVKEKDLEKIDSLIEKLEKSKKLN